MTSDAGHLDPEADLDNAALGSALRELLRAPATSAAPADLGQRDAEIRAAISRAWPGGVPPAAAAEHRDDRGDDHRAQPRPGGHGPPGAGPHAGLGEHDRPGVLGPHHLGQPGDPGHPGGLGHPGDSQHGDSQHGDFQHGAPGPDGGHGGH